MAHSKENRGGILYNRTSIRFLPAWSKFGTLFQWLMAKKIEEESFIIGDLPTWNKFGTLFQWLMAKKIEEESFIIGDLLVFYQPGVSLELCSNGSWQRKSKRNPL